MNAELTALCGNESPLLPVLEVVRSVEVPPVCEVGAVVRGKVVGVVVEGGQSRVVRGAPRRLCRRTGRAVFLT